MFKKHSREFRRYSMGFRESQGRFRNALERISEAFQAVLPGPIGVFQWVPGGFMTVPWILIINLKMH